MDEYTANPLQTEREAFRVLRKMNAEKADTAEAKQKAAEARELARRFVAEGKSVFGSGSGGGAGVLPKTGQKKAEHKKGGRIKAPTASKRADGIAQRGKTRGRMV